jgi:hypothetical protein
MEDIYPFNLEALINYDPRLLLNWEAEVYTIEVDKGYTMASGIMDKRLYEMSAARLGGDTYRNLSLNTQKTSQTFKHIILPVWIAAYQYNNQTYQFAINAQTGRVSGEKPYSWIKIFFACLFAVGIIALIYYISENNQ